MTPSLSCIRSEVLMSMRLRKKVSWYSEYNHLELLLLLDSIPHIPRSENAKAFAFALPYQSCPPRLTLLSPLQC